MCKKILYTLVCLIFIASCTQAPLINPTVPGSSANIPPTASPGQSATITAITMPSPTLTPMPFPLPNLPLDLLINAQPQTCMAAGSADYSEPAIDAATYTKYDFSSLMLERGTVIMVTNSSDENNGDVTSVAALLENPGTDGISLREALLAVNRDPGEYTIRFDQTLKGATIEVGSWDHTELPPLDSGWLIINGDTDGDGNTDITLENKIDLDVNHPQSLGFRLHSGENTLYSLKIEGFSLAVLMEPQSHDQIFAGNTLYHLVIEGGNGIGLDSRMDSILVTHNIWRDTKIIGNVINALGGMSLALTRASGDRIEDLIIEDNQIQINAENETDAYDGIMLQSGSGTDASDNEIHNVVIANNTIAGDPYHGIGLLTGYYGIGGNSIDHVYVLNNTIDIQHKDILATFGLQIAAGYWVNEKGNHISDILVSGNSITGHLEDIILVSSGAVGSSGNLIERIRISNNHLVVTKPSRDNGSQIMAVSIVTGDGATDYMDPSYQPVVYPDNNTVQDVWISHNVIEGQGGQAVSLGTGDPGSQYNQLKNIYILGNDMLGFYPGAGSMVSAVSLYLGGINDAHILNVFIQQNKIHQTNLRSQFIGEEFASGGIILTAGEGTQNSTIEDVWITANEIVSPAPGITILGGYSSPGMRMTQNNKIQDVQVWCNTVTEKPDLLEALFPGVKGINLAGGFGLTKNNSVSNIFLHGNWVTDVMDDLSVFQNAGEGSEANSVEYQIH
jgi:hypothetical protein